ncbi:MAG TPA: hypothetical protein DEP99_03505 [Nitrospiraceae bacterium]|nr:hypothetical protein [Nitrospiraceae bacterium]
MKCPSCNVELKISERQGIEIDYCPQCRGVWLDRGELDKLIERSSPVTPEHHKPGRHEHDSDYDDEHKRRKKRSFLRDIFD